MKEIIFAGFGGQGILSAGYLLAKIAVKAGSQVTWIPSYGTEMRGGTANCSVKISDKPIGSPFCEKIDILVALNESSMNKFGTKVRPNGLVVADTSSIRTLPEGIKALEINAGEIVRRHNNPRGLNLVMLGAVAGAIKVFPLDYYLEGISEHFKKYAHTLPQNIAVFKEGYALTVDGTDA